MSDLKKHLLDGTIALPQFRPFQVDDMLDPAQFVIKRNGQESIVVHLSIEYMARQFAGQAFENNRSHEFRRIWGTSDKDQNRFVDINWHKYIGDARRILAGMLGDPSTPQDQKDELEKAFFGQSSAELLIGRASGSLQVEPGTQAFEGDKAENRLIDEEGRGAAFVLEK